MTKTPGEFIGALSDEVAKEVGFEAQPESFDGIEIGAVARQVMNLEVIPLESLGFVPTGAVNDEESALGVYRGYFLGEMIEAILEHIGIDSVRNHRAALIRHFGPTAPERSSPVLPRSHLRKFADPYRLREGLIFQYAGSAFSDIYTLSGFKYAYSPLLRGNEVVGD